jgi:hypothetical protein
MKTVLAHFQSLPMEKKSHEIKGAETLLAILLSQTERARELDLCLTAGDLLIALESAGISHFLTLNGMESQHYCKVLEQTLIVHPVDPTKSEIVCPVELPQWPEFGTKAMPNSGTA